MMSGFGAMLRKELLELVRTLRGPVVLGVFLVIGLASPLVAKLTPELISSLASEQLTGMELLMTREPTTADALLQYQKNFGLMNLVVILLGMGMVSGEKRRGTAPLLMVKPVSRGAFVAAKLAAHGLLYLAGTAIAASGCLLYTTVLFGEVDLAGYLLMNGLLLLTLDTYLAVVLFGSVAFRSSAGSAGLGIGALALFGGLALVPSIGRYTPAGLGTAVLDLVQGRTTDGLATSIVASVALVTVLFAAAQRLFAAQEL